MFPLFRVAVVLGVLGVLGASDAVAAPHAAPSGAEDAIVRLSPRANDDDTFPARYRVIDDLEGGMVLRVRVVGFDSFAEGIAAQCVRRPREVDCTNSFPVQFDEGGRALFQYQLRDDFQTSADGSEACRAGGPRCFFVVRDVENGTTALIDTVFHGAVPAPGVIRVTPSSGLRDGQTVTVAVAKYPAGTQVTAMLCVAPDATGSQRCGSPGPSAPLTVGPDGTGSTEIVVQQGPVGSQRVSCDREATCGISVASADVFARAPVVPISFAGPTGAAYERNRVLVGIGIALLLIGIATWLLRRTDWSPPGEAAAPEIDNAEYADLDAIIAALPPEDDDALAETS